MRISINYSEFFIIVDLEILQLIVLHRNSYTSIELLRVNDWLAKHLKMLILPFKKILKSITNQTTHWSRRLWFGLPRKKYGMQYALLYSYFIHGWMGIAIFIDSIESDRFWSQMHFKNEEKI